MKRLLLIEGVITEVKSEEFVKNRERIMELEAREMISWKPILDGVYEISSAAEVRRLRAAKGTRTSRPVRTYPAKCGYLLFNASIDGEVRKYYVHRLLYEAFIGTIPEGCEINHRDANKLNNTLSNLEAVTHRENMRHAGRHGLMSRFTKPDTLRQTTACG